LGARARGQSLGIRPLGAPRGTLHVEPWTMDGAPGAAVRAGVHCRRTGSATASATTEGGIAWQTPWIRVGTRALRVAWGTLRVGARQMGARAAWGALVARPMGRHSRSVALGTGQLGA